MATTEAATGTTRTTTLKLDNRDNAADDSGYGFRSWL